MVKGHTCEGNEVEPKLMRGRKWMKDYRNENVAEDDIDIDADAWPRRKIDDSENEQEKDKKWILKRNFLLHPKFSHKKTIKDFSGPS
ncbi:hypothetical protein RUM43_003727 [Polyplax serrata]|uniref:Uncharacterized protein n=1 Tax=Polyplax serrata TaxID=468196 RepID=A0AAN8PHP6_POLSC